MKNTGYPFKSKKHSEWVRLWQKFRTLENHAGLQHYLHKSNDGITWSVSNSCPKALLYQFGDDFKMKISDQCCYKLKEEPLKKWQKKNNVPYTILGLMRDEGGRRISAHCMAFKGGKFKAFQPLVPVTKEWEQWYIDTYSVEICPIYLPPYNFVRTGCKGCPFNLDLQGVLDTLEKYFPGERKQCEIIWAPVYAEYRRIGYRLKQEVNT